MFKSAILYRISSWKPPALSELAERLSAHQFVEPGPTQPASSGWTPPRGDKHSALIEVVGGQWILKLASAKRRVPTQAVKDALEVRLEKIESETGRRPKGKAAKELKEEVVQELMPRAFPRRGAVPVWVDPVRGLIVVGASSIAASDHAVTLLVEALGGNAVVRLINSTTAPARAMATWLAAQEAPADFTVDRECELKQPDSEKAAVKYSRHTLDTTEVAEHVRQGKLPTQLAMTWNSRVSFVLSESMTLKRLKLLDVALEGAPKDGEQDGFDADVAIITGELTQLVSSLLAALDGEFTDEPQLQAQGAAPAASPAAPPAPTDDELLAQAQAVVLQHRRASISLVQRHLRIGYNRAARLLETLEQRGVISAMKLDGNREVLA